MIGVACRSLMALWQRRGRGDVGGHGADRLVFGDLPKEVWQHGAVVIAAGGELDGADVG